MIINTIDKINYIKHSLFNICPENSSSEGYTTEKIFQAFEAGTIPLYWGYDLPEKDILNKNKYCFCNVEDINTLKQQIEDLNNSIELNKSNIERYTTMINSLKTPNKDFISYNITNDNGFNYYQITTKETESIKQTIYFLVDTSYSMSSKITIKNRTI